jgi:hypothetical protein
VLVRVDQTAVSDPDLLRGSQGFRVEHVESAESAVGADETFIFMEVYMQGVAGSYVRWYIPLLLAWDTRFLTQLLHRVPAQQDVASLAASVDAFLIFPAADAVA